MQEENSQETCLKSSSVGSPIFMAPELFDQSEYYTTKVDL